MYWSYQRRVLCECELHDVCTGSSKDDMTKSCSVWTDHHLCFLEQRNNLLDVLLALEDNDLFQHCQ